MQKLSVKYLLPYVSDTVINLLSSKNKTGKVLEGSLVFADISGFTAMSERLAGMGRIGGEKLTEIINRCFNPLLDIVFACGGDVIKFGGDAFLVLFKGNDRSTRAFECAADLIDWISENGRIETPVGNFDLGIHTGISEGKIFNHIIGKTRKEHLFCGETVEKAYAAADMAGLGEIVLTPESAKNLKNVKLYKIDDGFYKFQPATNYEKNKKPKPYLGNPGKNLSGKILESFIDRRLREQLYYNKGKVDGEHRIITTLFIGIDSLRRNLEKNADDSLKLIRNYFEVLNGIIARNGGSLARIDTSPASEKILIFFGAPKCFGNDAQNCLRAVLEIESILQHLNRNFVYPIKHRYGVNSGLCFVGDVGGETRREYTAMGDAINLAARLMSVAEYGEIVVGQETEKSCRDDFKFKDRSKIRVKGKNEPVNTYLLTGEKERFQSDAVMIGREPELKRLENYVVNVTKNNRATMLITGEPGAGKSLLCSKLKAQAEEKGIGCYEGACYRQSEKTSYGPIKSILLEILKLGLKSSQKERRLALQKKLKELDEYEWESLIAPLLDYFPPVPPYLKNLPEETKKNKIESIICRLICGAAGQSNAVIIVEDIQWIDNASLEIIKLLLKSGDAPGLLFVGRPGDITEELKNLVELDEIELDALSPESSRELFLTVLKDRRPNESIIDDVIEKSGGNPFYLEEMAKAYTELGEARFESADNIPSGIESVITARIDNLGEMEKKTVRTASIIGRVFGYYVLKGIFPDRSRIGKLRDYLNELARLDLTPLERVHPVLEYIFKHILTQEVAYNGLSFSARKSLHAKTAEYFATRKRLVRRTPETIAGHYIKAEEFGKALPYLILSGKKAASEFANKEAFEYFGKALEIAEKLNQREYIIESLKNRGLLAKDTADYQQAVSDFSRLETLAGDDAGLRSFSARELSFIYRMMGEYDKASVSLNELEKIMPDDILNRVFCLNGRAEIARRSGKLPHCRELLLKAMDLIDNYEIDQGLKATVFNNLGICHWSLGRLKDAGDYYKTALKYYRKQKDLGGQSKIINNLGIISDELGKLHHAASSYEKAEKIFKRIGASRSEAYACANLGTNLMSRGHLSKAAEKLYRAKEIFDRIGDQHSSAYTLGDIGYTRFRQGDTEKGRELIGAAIEKAMELNDEELILESRIRSGRIEVYSGKAEIAEIEKLIDMAKKAGSSELEIKATIFKIYAYFISSDMRTVRNALNQVETLEELKNYPELRLELSVLRIASEYSLGNHARAVKLLKDSIRESSSRDLALVISELSAVGHACNLMEKIPEKTGSNMVQHDSRPLSGLNESETEKYRAFQRRTIEFYRKSIESGRDYAANVERPKERRSSL
ncbi:MAG: tetratricopeptide repeat protein [Candidatus Zixiibacteriota bacterium]|nr:MAG: tetratricopeptide repeat protein [candidate division Zixibacteria bacterium]